jgi:hypothetical protein
VRNDEVRIYAPRCFYRVWTKKIGLQPKPESPSKITVKFNTDTGLLQKALDAESNLIETPLPALYKRGIAKMLFLSICFSHPPL